MKQKQRYEVIIYGRGGQGAKTAAEILAKAAFLEGKFVQAFPEFGPERSGAPVRAFVRISDQPIRTHEPIIDPDCILVLDESLLSINKSIFENISPQKPVIVNSLKTKEKLAEETGFKGRIIPIDASRMSLDIIGENRPNTVMLGKFAFVTEIIRLESIRKAFKMKYLEKLGKEKIEKNLMAIDKAYSAI